MYAVPRIMLSAVVVLEWNFSPPDYFEEAIEIPCHDYAMTIADGKVQARIDSAFYEANPSMRQRLHDALNSRFLAVQLLTHRAFELSKAGMTWVHPDGRRDFVLYAESGHYVVSGSTVDFRVTDKDGNVIADSKRDRIEKKKSLAELVDKHSTDILLASLLRSYGAAVRDPNNELVYLYEIRDALSKKFENDGGARVALSISSTQWSRMGILCNKKPLRQGRHRGGSGGALRDASEAELTEARGIALAMIESYLRYLEGSTGS